MRGRVYTRGDEGDGVSRAEIAELEISISVGHYVHWEVMRYLGVCFCLRTAAFTHILA